MSYSKLWQIKTGYQIDHRACSKDETGILKECPRTTQLSLIATFKRGKSVIWTCQLLTACSLRHQWIWHQMFWDVSATRSRPHIPPSILSAGLHYNPVCKRTFNSVYERHEQFTRSHEYIYRVKIVGTWPWLLGNKYIDKLKN